MFKLDLNGKWRFKRVSDAEWLEGSVPGSVFNDLLEAGRIEDPFYRDNEVFAEEIASHAYEYVRSFDIDRNMLAHERITLLCKGFDTLAAVSVNGAPLGETENMHRIYEFDIKGSLREGANSIRVELRSPVAYIKSKDAETPLWGAQEAMKGFPHMRKAHCMFGWDWGPQIPDLGIWRDIAVTGYGEDRLEDVYVTQEHGDGRVGLDVRVRLDRKSVRPLTIRARVTAPDGGSVENTVSAAGDLEHIALQIVRPELWWPNGFGSQPLYGLEVELLENGALLDKKEMKTGLRTIRVKREKDSWGESFEFAVNGVSIFMMGADYIPEDNLLARCSRERTEKLIKNCVEANFNCLRIWGGGYYPEDYLYDLCDAHGLIIWQDFMFACAIYDLNSGFEQNIVREAADNIKRLRHHASLGIWGGNNEMETAWVNWEFPKTEKLRGDYIRMFEELLPAAVKEYDPNTFYWPSSPSSGGGFADPNSENMGDVHYWDVWHGLKPFTDYRKFHFRFVSEFGFQSFPCLKTVETFTLPEDRNIFSYVMEKHQKNGSANGRILYYLSENFRYPRDFEALLYTSQLLQAEAIKYGVEHWRRNRGRCMGAIYWQLNDCWPVASWASIDCFGRWKALHYFAKRFFAPVLLSACEEGLGVSLHVTNETMEPFTGEIRWKLRSNDSEILEEGAAEAQAGPLSSGVFCSLDFAGLLADKALQRRTYLEYGLYSGALCIGGGTVLFAMAKHFEFLDPHLAVRVRDAGEEFRVEVFAQAYAKYVGLDLSDADCIFSDNYFDMTAGESKLVTVKKSDLSRAMTAEEFIEGLNARSIYDLS